MVYSIGYQGISADELVHILTERKVTHLVDVRSKPYSRWKKEFNKPALERHFENSDIIYIWAGKTLGGLSEIAEDAIEWLASFQTDRIVSIMCMEADYKKCHRFNEIALRLEKYDISTVHIQAQKFTKQSHLLFFIFL